MFNQAASPTGPRGGPSKLSQASSRTRQTTLRNSTPMSTRRRSCRCQVHADTAEINLNVWLTDDSANLGSFETDDGGGLTVFHAKPPGGKSDFVITMIAKVMAIVLELIGKPWQPLRKDQSEGTRAYSLPHNSEIIDTKPSSLFPAKLRRGGPSFAHEAEREVHPENQGLTKTIGIHSHEVFSPSHPSYECFSFSLFVLESRVTQSWKGTSCVQTCAGLPKAPQILLLTLSHLSLAALLGLGV